MMRVLIVIGLLLAIPELSLAQFPAEVKAGTRVRVWIPETPRQESAPEHRQLLRGTVESVDAAALRLAVPGTGGSLSIPRASVRRLDVSHGVSRGVSMVERAVGGAIGGALILGVMNNQRATTGLHYHTDWEAAGVGAAFGGGAGALIGLIFPYENWRRVLH
jgi:hypothetical protein